MRTELGSKRVPIIDSTTSVIFAAGEEEIEAENINTAGFKLRITQKLKGQMA
ncbi:hypothetical protein ACFL0M_01520 [Thermodesulfobacteriota bacterium]